mmetsp:Transcript_7746/g.16797  ORF Transcript_7746/g.16797 Transcript_7746/m.16797 type:complete len:138 (-) Transcript_7746:231-644(-)
MDGKAIFCIFAFVESSDAASEDCETRRCRWKKNTAPLQRIRRILLRCKGAEDRRSIPVRERASSITLCDAGFVSFASRNHRHPYGRHGNDMRGHRCHNFRSTDESLLLLTLFLLPMPVTHQGGGGLDPRHQRHDHDP